jgi:NDP-sugar pyrophosphorylase family protein
MKAVILAGGLGTRLKPFTQVIPKSLLPIGESSVLEIQILSLARHGVDQVYVATNYRSEYVRAFLGDGAKYGVNVAFSEEEKPLGTCGPVSLLRDELREPFLLMNGDILTTLDFTKAYQYATQLDADLVVVTTELVTPFHFGKVLSDGTYITEMQEKPDITLEILSGIYILKPPVFDLIPVNTYYGIDNLIRDMLARKMKVGKYLMQEYWLDIGRIADYQVAQDAYREHFTDLSTKTP